MTQAPLKLTLYNPEDSSIEQELSRVFIPTGIFTEIVRLLKEIDLEHPENLDENATEAIYALTAEIYGHQVTVDQVKEKTDLVEVLMLLKNVMARVNAAMPQTATQSVANPTRPGAARKKH